MLWGVVEEKRPYYYSTIIKSQFCKALISIGMEFKTIRVGRGGILVPLKPSPDLIFYRLRLCWIYPVLEDSDLRNKKGGICAPADLPPR